MNDLKTKTKLADNIRRVKDRIGKACEDAGRDPSDVRLVAVTKYAGFEMLKLLPELGVLEIGESRGQELAKRAALLHEHLSDRSRQSANAPVSIPRWHMVGHLQRNKVKQVLPWADTIQSVDSLRLAEEVDLHAGRLDRKAEVLMQVNTSGESAKFGVAVGAATHLAEHIASLPNVSLCGLMAMGPNTDDRRAIYDSFVRCHELFDEIAHEVRVGEQFRHLSLGMSHDYDIGIACGATMVRIGRALFEGIPLPDSREQGTSARAK